MIKVIYKLTIVFGIISAFINAYALISALLGISPSIPTLFWGLSFGMFLCLTPAVWVKSRIVKQKTKSYPFLVRPGIGGWFMWDGIPKWPFIVLWLYGMMTARIIPDGGDPPWLSYSVGWMIFYYISWALLKQEIERRENQS